MNFYSGVWIDSFVEKFARVLNIISAIWLSSIALLILFDVVGREFFNTPFHGTNEIVSNSVLSILFLQLPLSILTRSSLRTTIFYGNVGKKVNYYKNQLRLVHSSYAKEVPKLFSDAELNLENTYNKIRKNELNHWNDNANSIQKEFVTYEKKTGYAERQTWHMIDEYRKENKRVRKTKPPSFFNVKFSVPEDVKDPKKAFPEVAHYYMDDPTREVKKLKISEDIDQKYKKAEKEIEDLQAASVAKQKELHEKYSTH